MKKIVFLFIVLLIAAGFIIYSVQNVSAQQTASQQAASQQTAAQQAAAEISFIFTRLSGSATNQFAVWVEDSAGRYIKTLFVTQWTAKGGWKRRETSIPAWVKKSNVSNLTNLQIDAVSGATPGTGTLNYIWDGTDSNGVPALAGDYVVILEGTLRWENIVVYRAPIYLGSGYTQSQASAEYAGDSSADRNMIANVSVRVLK